MSLPEAVVLFGASGFIGRNIVAALQDRLSMLIGVTSSGRPVPGCSHTVAAPAMNELPALPAKTTIIHVAALRYDAASFAHQQAEILWTNVALSKLVYRFALSRGITEIRVAGSAAVYPASWTTLDDAQPLDLNDWPHEGEAPYAWSKRWGEIEATLWQRSAGVNTITLRLSNPYGPFDTLDEHTAHVATAFAIRALGEGGDFEIRGDPDAERDFVHAEDVASAFVASLALQGVHDAVNCALGITVRIRDLAVAAMRAAGRERPLRINRPASGASSGVKLRRVTASRLRTLLPTLSPFRSIDQGMCDTVHWYRDALR